MAGVMALVLVVFLACLSYKIYKFCTADGDLHLLSHTLKPDYFKGKVVWVTGASSGIGEELCKQLSPLGAKIILSARSEDKLQDVSKSLANPEDSRVLPLDMLDTESFPGIVNQAKNLFGRIDILVNNAGVASRSDFMDFADKISRQLFDVNFLNTVLLTREVLKVMLDQANGDIVSISSVSGKAGGSRRHYYGASKAALLSMMDSLRIDYTDNNINFINILPGPVKTPVAINALTGDGSKFGKMDAVISTGMKVERCCELMLVAISNHLTESWISTHPYLYLTYLGQYAPSLQLRESLRRKRANNVKATTQKVKGQ